MTTWAWVHISALSADVQIAADPDVKFALGRPGAGPDGFCASHRDAIDAARVAGLVGSSRDTVTRYASVELAALCSADLPRCRDFVRTELGPLASDDDAARRVRATLEIFLEEGSNFRGTARRLGIHHNTVVYRVQQAERQLGHPIADRRLALGLALNLARVLAVAAAES